MNRLRILEGTLLLAAVGVSPSLPGAATPSQVKKSISDPASHKAFSSKTASQAKSAASDTDTHLAFGSKSAPITMEVFSDFQCPACKTLYNSTWQQLMDNYVSAGKVYLIHRNFPLPNHAYSRVAARYAVAAGRLGRFEPVEQVLFRNQEKWEQNGDVDGTVASVLSPAEMTKVRGLVKGGTLDAEIDRDYALGQGYHVTQTPTSILHAKGQIYPVVGVVSYQVLKQFLDQLVGP